MVERLRVAVAARIARDPAHASLRRATRTAIAMPALFAFGDQVVGRPQYTLFAAFGAFALIGLVEFGGPFENRVRSQVALIAAAAAAIVAGTLASRDPLVSAAVMAVGTFVVLFVGVVSSQIARASNSVILPLIVATALPAGAGQLPERLAGFATAAAVSLVAMLVLWPLPTRDPLRAPIVAACRSLAAALRPSGQATVSRDASIATLSRAFLATPFRPTGLGTETRLAVRLVEELAWLDRAISRWRRGPDDTAVELAAAHVLDACADGLEPAGERRRIGTALDRLRMQLGVSERAALADADDEERARIAPEVFADGLMASFRAQELAFAVSTISETVDATLAAEERSWWSTLLGHQVVASGQLLTARQRVRAHLHFNSVWFRNSLRGAVALGLATLIADEVRVQHSFWVIFGALSVLRSNALSTGQFVGRAVWGTIVGFAVGAVIVSVVGTDTGPLWAVLPLSVLIGGLAPAVVSFAVGQAAFTVTILVLFTIIAPDGWRLGVVRVEDVLLGCAVSLAVALVFWPRGAGAQLRAAVAEAYTLAAQYLADAVDFASACCSFIGLPPVPPTREADLAAAATRRLDDAFRTYLAERGAKSVPLSEVMNLVVGCAVLRLTADAVLALWRDSDPPVPGAATEARGELVAQAARVRAWFDAFAQSLVTEAEIPEPLDAHSRVAFLAALGNDLAIRDGRAATSVRLVWTDFHLGAAVDLQRNVVDSARVAVTSRRSVWPTRVSLRAKAVG